MCKNGLSLQFLIVLVLVLISTADSRIFTNDWVVTLKDHGDPDLVAELHGFENLGRLHEEYLDNVYHFRHPTIEKRHPQHRRDVTELLNTHEMIEDSEQDEIVELDKRAHKGHKGSKENIQGAGADIHVDTKSLYNDPNWPLEWFLNSADAGPYEGYEYNINVLPAWEQGYNGSGIVVCVIDDGIEKSHEDLAANYDPKASYDFQDDDDDPSPRYATGEPNRHGTRCAGEIAAIRNNGICGVGVAHASKIGGIRILDGPVTRIMESKALGFNIGYVDIFSASWGPPDNGKAMDGPKGITWTVLEHAMAKGRDGKGTIYVWAGGNGGKNDDCNADGYQTMRTSVSISAVGLNGDTPYYAEPCASALAATFSSGFVHSIATTDIHGKCTQSHSGTSAAAPIAAGIIALALQANSELTWRDVQHVIIRVARPDKLFHHDGWVRNGANRPTHIHFGYGIIDAGLIVEVAKNWTNVGPDHRCQSPKLTYNRAIPPHENVSFEILFDGCDNTNNTVNYLEHVYLEVDLETTRRGDISINLTSPAGTEVGLMSTRQYDSDNIGFKNWRLMTVFLFGENPSGAWKVDIANTGKYISQLKTMFLDVYGTEEAPVETNINIPHNDDDSVCDVLCGLAGHALYDSAKRCKKCSEVVKVDIDRREQVQSRKRNF